MKKVCPECLDDDLLSYSWSDDGTTDCLACSCNWEEEELIIVNKEDKI